MTTADEQEENLLRPVNAELIPETGYLVVTLNKQVYGFVDQPVRYQGRTFQPKSELHITVISQDAEKIMHYLENDPDAPGSIQELITGTDWRFRKLPAFYHVIEVPGVETIIQMVEIPNLEAFLRELSGQTGHGFLLPPTHVTLYTRGTESGIGLPSQSVFQEMVQGQVRLEELQPVQNEAGSRGEEQGLV